MTTDSPMSCAQVDELLPEYSTGELDPSASRAIEEHTRTCEACAREIAGWTRAGGLVRRAATEEEPVRIASPMRRSAFPPFARPLALAASLALAFGLGIFAGRSGSTPAPQLAAETRESIASRYREVAAASPGSSSLGLALMSIARRN
ncbi:MAG: zf-HC2 domain-containing protein [Phycisphaeraceae bacterium]|nr:zf-HC2 domain-containing protein [Phycisphaeraceae bacterium]